MQSDWIAGCCPMPVVECRPELPVAMILGVLLVMAILMLKPVLSNFGEMRCMDQTAESAFTGRGDRARLKVLKIFIWCVAVLTFLSSDALGEIYRGHAHYTRVPPFFFAAKSPRAVNERKKE